MAAVPIHSDFRAQERKICHCFHFFPIYLLWSDGTSCHDISFLNVEFKPVFSLSSFTPTRSSLVPLCFLPLKWCHLHIWGCWCFSWQSWSNKDAQITVCWTTLKHTARSKGIRDKIGWRHLGIGWAKWGTTLSESWVMQGSDGCSLSLCYISLSWCWCDYRGQS